MPAHCVRVGTTKEPVALTIIRPDYLLFQQYVHAIAYEPALEEILRS